MATFWTRAEAQATSSRGKAFRVTARGWSNDSLEEAQKRALEIAQRIAQIVASGFSSRQRYPYGERPLPEPVIREFQNDSGDKSAVVTRNAYGALVLNANQLMFVDVDRKDGQPGQGTSLGNIFSNLFGKPKALPKQSPQILDVLNDVTQRHGLAARVYETKAGYRGYDNQWRVYGGESRCRVNPHRIRLRPAVHPSLSHARVLPSALDVEAISLWDKKPAGAFPV